MNIARLTVSGLLFVGLLCGCNSLGMKRTPAYISGRSQAMDDLMAGRLELETAGLPAEWTASYERILLERHGIRTRAVAGCIVTDQILDHIRGYNEVMEREAETRFGRGILKKTRMQAQKAHGKIGH